MLKTQVMYLIIGLMQVLMTTAYAENINLSSQQLGREFGLTVGDVIHHRYEIDVQKPYVLAQSSLPVKGDLTYWLNVRDVQVAIESSKHTNRYMIDLKYQVFYAPLDVRELIIPAIELLFSNGEQRENLLLAAWPFTISPLKEIKPSGVAAGENDTKGFMKMSIAPERMSTKRLLTVMGVCAVVFFLVLCVWLALNGWLPKWRGSPFIEAKKQIKSIMRQKNHSAIAYKHSLQCVHHAINQRAGFTMFGSTISQFVQHYPQFSGIEYELKQFFSLSQSVIYFDDKADKTIFTQCMQLCQLMINLDKVVKKNGH